MLHSLSLHRRFSSLSSLRKIGILGGGKMAEAIVGGWIQSKLVNPKALTITDPNSERQTFLQQRFPDVTVSGDAQWMLSPEFMEGADMLVLAVKPQVINDVVAMRSYTPCDKSPLVLSIVAGLPLEKIEKGFSPYAVRTMPNTPAMVQRGMTVWTATPKVSHAQRNCVKQALGALGEELWVSRESDIDIATALSGTGPAYVYLVMEAMIDAGVHMGLNRSAAAKMVETTLAGTVEYARKRMKEGVHLSSLRNDITSPGGTTADALYEAERGGLRAVLADVVWAAYRRSLELKEDSSGARYWPASRR